MAENGCSGCHRSHTAEHPVRLLRAAEEEQVCLPCHGGQVAKKDIAAEFGKVSAHRVDAYTDVHDPVEDPYTMPIHVECVDCHEPHETRAEAPASALPGPLTGVSGLDIDGGFLTAASFDYEICLKCHGVSESASPIVVRDDNVTNVLLEFAIRNVSFHPIADIGRNPEVRTLIPPLTPASRISCVSCHDSDAAGSGSAPRGAHGSIYEPILAHEYRLVGTAADESYEIYSLCYGCHNRDVLLNEGTLDFPHLLHVSEIGASCAVCHDAHGSRNNPHLINFMTNDLRGTEIVQASSGGSLGYESLGPGSGRCYLTCHGEDHSPREYGQLSEVAGTGAGRLPGSWTRRNR